MIIALMGVAATALVAVSCTGGANSSTAVSAGDSVAASTYASDGVLDVDSAASYLTWKGFKPGGEHFGKLPVSEGSVSVVDGKLYGGHVVIAMNGIIVEDIQGEMADMLKAHLENEDFFEVATYPTARFELTDVPAEGVDLSTIKELKGNLTLKDVTKNITIPVSAIEIGADNTTFKSATFRINRADWNVKYGSKSFFTGLGDKFIDDEIELSFVLVTK